MPAPPRLCSCGAIVAAGSLCACQRDRTRTRGRRHDARRPNSRQRGYTREWEALRAEFLRLHPTCAFCGCGAEVVDHIKRHHGDRALVMNWNNLQSLCKRCHDSEKQRAERLIYSHSACHRRTAKSFRSIFKKIGEIIV